MSLASNQPHNTHTHLNYDLCQIHKTHILSHCRLLTEARLADDPMPVLYSKCQLNPNSRVKLGGSDS